MINSIDLIHKYMKKEINAMQTIESTLDDTQYMTLVSEILNLEGRLIFIGVGKTGHIGVKLAATFASLGTPSFFVHATEAMHGDLGMIKPDDLVIIISNSGETKETLAPLHALNYIGAKTVAFTGKATSSLANSCDLLLLIPITEEADDLDLAPTNSSTAALMVGDAIACTISRIRNFSAADFAKFHPGGALGKRLLSEGQI